MSYRAFWQRRCRAAAAGAVLKPQGGNCAVLPMVSGTPSSYTLKVPRAVKLFPPLNQRVAARIRLIRQVQRKALIAVHNACLAVLVLPRDVGSIGQVDMPVQHQSRVIGIQNFIEHRKPAVRQVAEIPGLRYLCHAG